MVINHVSVRSGSPSSKYHPSTLVLLRISRKRLLAKEAKVWRKLANRDPLLATYQDTQGSMLYLPTWMVDFFLYMWLYRPYSECLGYVYLINIFFYQYINEYVNMYLRMKFSMDKGNTYQTFSMDTNTEWFGICKKKPKFD